MPFKLTNESPDGEKAAPVHAEMQDDEREHLFGRLSGDKLAGYSAPSCRCD